MADLYSQRTCRMFIVAEETLGKRKGNEEQLIVVFELVDSKRTGDEGVLVTQRLIGA